MEFTYVLQTYLCLFWAPSHLPKPGEVRNSPGGCHWLHGSINWSNKLPIPLFPDVLLQVWLAKPLVEPEKSMVGGGQGYKLNKKSIYENTVTFITQSIKGK